MLFRVLFWSTGRGTCSHMLGPQVHGIAFKLRMRR
jgi:hypothetical protein